MFPFEDLTNLSPIGFVFDGVCERRREVGGGVIFSLLGEKKWISRPKSTDRFVTYSIAPRLRGQCR